jgi:hypothetical protein
MHGKGILIIKNKEGKDEPCVVMYEQGELKTKVPDAINNLLFPKRSKEAIPEEIAGEKSKEVL